MAERSGGKRETIKAEALKMFAERGVDAVSVQDIATACDMAKPNLYAHFRSKDDLVRDLFVEGYRDYGRQMNEAAAAGGAFSDRLDRLVRLACRLHDEDHLRFRFLLMSHYNNLPGAQLGQTNPVEIVIRLVTEAMASGEIPARDPVLAASGIIGLVLQPATFLQYGRLHSPLSRMADEIVASCLRLLA